MSTKETFAVEIQSLARKYIKHRDQYREATYNETDVRNEFLNRMFTALGWDIDNTNGSAPADREVWLERGDCKGKRPDYNFRLSGKTKFYLEAKAPHVKVNSSEVIYQAKSYSWSTTESLVSIAVVSNFDETIILDTTLVPDFNYPDRGVLFQPFSVEDYSNRAVIDKLWLLSRHEMEKGTLEELTRKDKKRDTFRVRPDDRLLDLLNGFRVDLASSIFLKNKGMELDKIQDVVCTVLNRFLFMRVLEDRGTVDKRELKDVVDTWEEDQGKKAPLLIKSVRDQFTYINENFNGKLFDGDPLKGVDIDADVLAGVIKNLYGKNCPFAFNRLDLNTLGHIYEQFLSHELSKAGRGVALKEREYIRKSGGVFYTPKEVVEYMCKESIIPVIKNVKDLSSVRLLDFACGSGSFLITGYRMLLKEAASRSTLPFVDLPFTTKRDLLLKCVYGVDIDREATKVAVLSLCLAALENEPHISKGKRLLPNLKSNVIVADGLLDEPAFGRECTPTRIFPPKGGRLCIIGNPPYLNVKRDFLEEDYKEHLEATYESAHGQWDSYTLFLERAAKWNADSVSLIVPKPILTNENQTIIRKILANHNLSAVTDMGAVFKDAAVETAVITIASDCDDSIKTFKWNAGNVAAVGEVGRASILAGEPINLYSSPKLTQIFGKIESSKKRLKDLVSRPVLRGVEKGKNALDNSPGKGKVRCHAGAEIQGMIADTPGSYIKADWNDKSTFKEQNLYAGPKVLFRRVTNDLLAAVDNSDFPCLNTLYVVRPIDPIDPEILAAYASTSIVQFWFKQKYVNDDILFPYVRTNQIADIPFPEKLEKFCSDASAVAQQVVHGSGKKKVDALAHFETIVARHFGLSETDLVTVERSLAAFEKKAA
jgi:type I restriction-modification system DNA methylase subunit